MSYCSECGEQLVEDRIDEGLVYCETCGITYDVETGEEVESR